MVRLPVHNSWVLTANNPRLSDEIARRYVGVRLDPGCEEPWKRIGFRHGNLKKWVQARRGQLIWACLTIIRAWIVEGRVAGSKSLGGYESWAETMGGILDVCGIEGFLGNLDVLHERAAVEERGWKAFVKAWWEEFKGKQVSAGELYQALWNSPSHALRYDLLEGPIELTGYSDRSVLTELGKKIAKQVDRVFGGYRIRRGSIISGIQKWSLEKQVAPGGPGGPLSPTRAEEVSGVSKGVEGRRKSTKSYLAPGQRARLRPPRRRSRRG
jgi:hypothetical protein